MSILKCHDLVPGYVHCTKLQTIRQLDLNSRVEVPYRSVVT